MVSDRSVMALGGGLAGLAASIAADVPVYTWGVA